MTHTGLIPLIVLLMVQVLNRKLSYIVTGKIEKNNIYKCFFYRIVLKPVLRDGRDPAQR